MSNPSKKTYDYKSFKVDHRSNPEAPEIYLLTADAYEITQWADVPRKGRDYMEGYQRQLDEDRVDDIKDYFDLDGANIIPGSILIAIDENAVTFTDRGDSIYDVSIEDTAGGTADELIQRKFTELYDRLGQEERDYVDGNKSDDDGRPPSYLARLTRELKRATTDFNRFSGDDQDAIETLVKSTTRPGLILDGQHRVHGASKVAENINLPVVLMPRLEKSEQVFHFYIVNNKAEPLKPEQLLITLATSLTDAEVKDLFDRLEKAGEDAEEAKLAYRADTSRNSPFAGLVDYEGAVGEQTGVFRYKSLHRVITEFVKMPTEFKELYKDIDEWESDDDYSYRMSRFYVFWNAIKNHYPELWNDAVQATLNNKQFDDEKPEQFFFGVTMRVLQKYILDHMTHLNSIYVNKVGTGPILSDEDTLKEVVDESLDGIHSDFFRREWEVTSLDTSDGRDWFKGQLEAANGMEPRYLHTLGMFRGR